MFCVCLIGVKHPEDDIGQIETSNGVDELCVKIWAYIHNFNLYVGIT
jgi:hypothetical protein